MKKLLFLGFTAFMAFAASAQNNQPAPLLKVRVKTIMDNGLSTSISPLKTTTLPDAKSGIQRIPFGSSFNMLTLTETDNNNCVYNADLGIMMFTHRAGGSYGGASGDIRSHFTTYFGTNIDSVQFVHQGSNNMRYPCGVIYNPAGNTNLANAMAIITGPCTDGTNWNNNYFCTQMLDGSSLKYHFEPTFDTLRPANINLTVCDNGRIRVAGEVSGTTTKSNPKPAFYFRSGQVQGDSVLWGSNYYFNNYYHDRIFSTDTTSWAFAPYLAFSKDGMIGYFYVMGWDATDNGINSGPAPIVWKTIDGGTSWTKMPLVDLSIFNPLLSNYIKPTRLTLYDTINPVYRPGIMSGATTEETNFPGVVDINGNLHIACSIEGMYSSNIDSLSYTYASNLPFTMGNIFDLHTTSTGWDMNNVDTIHAGIEKKVTLTDSYLDHNFHVAKNSDGSKIFFMWTDSDLDTSNYLPDIHARAYDMASGFVTPSKELTFQTDYYFFNASEDVVDSVGTYFLPSTFAVIHGSTTDAEPIHNFIKGLKIASNEFAGINKNETSVAIDNVSVYPNPTTDFVNIKLSLTKSENVKIIVYNLLGTEVLNKNFGKLISGENKITLNTNNLNSGIYFFTVQAGNERITKKIVVD